MDIRENCAQTIILQYIFYNKSKNHSFVQYNLYKKKTCIDAKIGNFKKYGHTTYLIRLDLVRAEICGQ